MKIFSKKNVLRAIASFSIIACFFLIWLAFPQPDPKLWPPKVKNEEYKIHLTVGEFHTCLDFPDYNLKAFQEWHMGAKEWYFTEKTEIYNLAAKALSKRVDGVIKFGVFAQPFWEREGISKENVFTFWLSKAGFARLLETLHKHRGEKIARKNSFWYYEYTAGYHLLDNCNGFIAQALCKAGLPIRKILAQESISMKWQLRRCLRIQDSFYSKNVQPPNCLKQNLCMRGSP